MLFVDKWEVRSYVNRRVDKKMDAKYVDVVRRMAEGDTATQAVFARHREQLDAQLTGATSVLLQDAVVRANLLGAVRQENEARLQRLEAQYTWDVRAAKYMAGAACLTLLGLFGAAAANAGRRE